MEKAPFVYGRITDSFDFTNREKEQLNLIQNFNSGINTMLISPRRWGKSSLVKHVSQKLQRKNKKIRFCFIDLFNTRSEQEFYELYAKELLLATSNKWEEAVNNSKKFLSKIIPQFSFSPEANSEFSISFDWEQAKNNAKEILNLPEIISKEKNIQLVVCIDEFQNLSFFDDSLAFQKKLRAHWQQHKNASYCLYGSKRHMLMDFFTKPSMPFYKFGDILFLEKIKTEHWIPFIQQRFIDTGKKISENFAEEIAVKMENHPYFVQQFAQMVWLKTIKSVNSDVMEYALETLLNQNTILFQREVDQLTNMQLNFLKALCNDVEQFSAATTLKQYNMGTSANVLRIKQALENKEIIDTVSGKPEFLDPLFKIWLKQVYFSSNFKTFFEPKVYYNVKD
jgi:hypothetical protein